MLQTFYSKLKEFYILYNNSLNNGIYNEKGEEVKLIDKLVNKLLSLKNGNRIKEYTIKKGTIKRRRFSPSEIATEYKIKIENEILKLRDLYIKIV